MKQLHLTGLSLGLIIVAVGALMLATACDQPTGSSVTTEAEDDTGDPEPESDPDPEPEPEPQPEPELQHIAIDFDTATANYVADGFAAGGMALEPEPGQLNANSWQIVGFSDGDVLFGEESAAGDLARGASAGGVSTGGLYAFAVEEENTALGVQPTASDFAPGHIALRVPVEVAEPVHLSLAYSLWTFNDQDRSTLWSFEISLDATSWSRLEELDYATPVEADAAPEWQQARFTSDLDVTPLSLTVGDEIFIRWYAADHEGSGGRDEMAIDDIAVTFENAP